MALCGFILRKSQVTDGQLTALLHSVIVTSLETMVSGFEAFHKTYCKANSLHLEELCLQHSVRLLMPSAKRTLTDLLKMVV